MATMEVKLSVPSHLDKFLRDRGYSTSIDTPFLVATSKNGLIVVFTGDENLVVGCVAAGVKPLTTAERVGLLEALNEFNYGTPLVKCCFSEPKSIGCEANYLGPFEEARFALFLEMLVSGSEAFLSGGSPLAKYLE